MNKPLLITVGIIFILIVLGVWVYLMIFGTPESTDDLLYDLGIETATMERPDQPITQTPETIIDVSAGALQQLTTRPIAGFVFTASSSEQRLTYVERGTGYIYQIDINTGVEVRLSGTTIPRVVDAVFSKEGSSVVLVSENDYVQDIFIGRLATTTESVGMVDYVNLPPNAENFNFLSETKIRYTISDEQGTKGFLFDMVTKNQEPLFTVPFSQITILWRDKYTLAFNKPAATLQGGFYVIEDTALIQMLPPKYGRVILAHDYVDTYVDTYIDNTSGTLVSDAYTQESSNGTSLPILVIPEKCDFSEDDSNILWCAATLDETNRTYIDEWYQGSRTSKDMLWEVNIEEQGATFVVDFLEETGRAVDVERLEYVDSEGFVFFSNKVDNALWMYDTTY